MYRLPAKSKIEFIALKVSNINQMVDFYTKVIGLYLIQRNEEVAYLGFPNRKRVFICLKRINTTNRNRHAANIKSFSLILPNQSSFKRILVYIRNLGIKVRHIETNLFFDRFHLNDPEGNRVTLGFEKVNMNSVSNKSITEQHIKKINLNDYLGDYSSENNHLPDRTKIYRVQMSVPNLKESLKFYRNQLGFNYQINKNKSVAVLTSSATSRGQQLILKQTPHISTHNSSMPGLDFVNIRMSKASEIEKLAKHLSKRKVEFTYSRPNRFIFVSDPSDINYTFSLL